MTDTRDREAGVAVLVLAVLALVVVVTGAWLLVDWANRPTVDNPDNEPAFSVHTSPRQPGSPVQLTPAPPNHREDPR